MFFLLIVSSVYSLATLFGANAWVRRTDEIRVKVAYLTVSLGDAEVGARGYIVTGERAFLEPYDRARAAWKRHFGEVSDLTADNDEQQDRLRRLDEIWTREMANVAGMIAARSSGPLVVTPTLAMESSKRAMDAARELLSEMARDEKRRDEVREHEARRRGWWTMGLFVGGAAVSLVIVAAIGRQRRLADARRARAEEEGRLLQDVFAGIDHGITIQDRTGELIFANANAAQMIGFQSVDALLEASFSEIAALFELFGEDGLPFAPARLPSRAVLSGSPAPEPVVLRFRTRATNEDRWSLTQAFPVRDAAGKIVRAVNVFRDVTKERKAEERRTFLLRAVDELSSSLDYEVTLAAVARLAVPTLADWCAVDILEDGRVRRLATAHVDPAKVAFVAELERRYPSDPNAPNGVPEIIRSGKAQLMPEIPRELLIEAAVDDVHMGLINALQLSSFMGVPLALGGRVLGAITFAMAESQRRYGRDDLALAQALADRAALAVENAGLFREVERARAAAAAQLAAEEQRRREAENQARFAETFVGILGHDLRNPLNAILMTSRLLRHKGSSEPAALDRIQSSAQRMSNMVGQLLDLTRSRLGGGIPLDKKPIDLGPVVSEVVDEVRRGHPGREIVWNAPRESSAMVDRDRIQQAASNLLGNAIEHGDPDWPVTVELSASPERVVLRVHNEGPPIAQELIPSLFEPFRSRGRGERSKGLGLGLFITEQIVAAHAGRVDVSSAVGEGTTFVVVLPRGESEKGGHLEEVLLS